MKDVFARFSLDLGDSANWYVQGTWAQAENASDWIHWVVSPNASRPNTLFANNPFLTPATQQLLGASIVCGTPGRDRLALPAGHAATSRRQTGTTPPPPPTTPFFSSPRYLNTIDGQEVNGEPEPPVSHSRRSADMERGNRPHR